MAPVNLMSKNSIEYFIPFKEYVLFIIIIECVVVGMLIWSVHVW